jgi:argininosuccinate lyase
MAAMDLAELLVEKNIPFRTAHHDVGALVTKLEADGRGLPEATDEELASVGGGALSGASLTATWCIERKLTQGSTAPDEVKCALAAAKASLA